jgi:hypothetical protein
MIVYRVGGHDAELLAPEFHPGSVDAGLELSADFRRVLPGDLVAQEPFTAWLRRGIARDRIRSVRHRSSSDRPGQGRPFARRALRASVDHVAASSSDSATKAASVARLWPRPSRLPASRRLRRP